ncbi:MAG: chemotaxis protein CheX [Phycisphaerales bacterium]
MDQSYITAFVKSTRSIFETMLQMPVEIGSPSVCNAAPEAFDVSAVIGLQGDVGGSVLLSFPRTTAERLVSVFTGVEFSGENEDLSDAVGELVNIIAGGAKAQFDGQKVGLGIPSVVIGAEHAVFGSRDVVRVAIPCSCDCGEFMLEIALKSYAQNPSTDKSAAGKASSSPAA